MTVLDVIRDKPYKEVVLGKMMGQMAHKEWESFDLTTWLNILTYGTKGYIHMNYEDFLDLHKDMFPQEYSDKDLEIYSSIEDDFPRVHRAE
tara:strand:- start:114 stop:386 length:273 start_codon:yes stop_codon:yes gene_type:complete